MIWNLWVRADMINGGLATWLLPLCKEVFQRRLAYGWISAAGVVASIVCARLLDKVGRKPR